jgi:hypothetical protein
VSLFLEEQEVDAICAPLRQPSAQFRKLTELGIKCWLNKGRKARVVVPRLVYERWKNPPPPPMPEPELWVRPPPPPWEETALGRWQAEQNAGRREREEEAARMKALDDENWEATRPQREAGQRLQRAALVRFHANKRRTTKLQRTPAWADQEAIRAVYLEAQRLTRDTRVAHHVDHVIPLQGKRVSGLHVHNNLQILTGSENSKKRNHYEVEA